MAEQNSGPRRALIVGLGITGISVAVRLRQIGWEPVIVERSPQRRTGGYFVLLYNAGRAAAGRMGIMPYLQDRSPIDGSHFVVDRQGGRRRAPAIADLPGNPYTMLRGDVEDAAFKALPADVEIRYGTTPTEIAEDGDVVRVTTRDSAAGTERTEDFDLVVGADGLRSTVRRLVFGPDERFLRRMNHIIAAFHLQRPPAGLSGSEGAVLIEPNRALWVFGFENTPPTVMLTYACTEIDAEFDRPGPARLRQRFGPEPAGALLGDVLDQAEQTPDMLFDSVEQVHMPTWHTGRVVLVGDAAWCLTLYSGMGVSAGLSGADLLGTMLERHPGDVAAALDGWERRLRPVMKTWQQLAKDMRLLFNPASEREILLRRFFSEGLRYPLLRLPLKSFFQANSEIKNADVARPRPGLLPKALRA